MNPVGWQLDARGGVAVPLTDGMVLAAENALAPPAMVAPEIMFLVTEVLEGPGVTAAAVCTATRVAAGLAVTEDGRGVTGVRLSAQARPCDFDLSLVGALLEVNGDVVATAAGAAVAGHPAEAVAAFINHRAAAGEPPLQRGQVIGSGLLMEPRPVAGPGEVSATFGHLGTVTLPLRGCP